MERDQPRSREKDCRDGRAGGRGGSRGVGFMRAHKEGDPEPEGPEDSKDLARLQMGCAWHV